MYFGIIYFLAIACNRLGDILFAYIDPNNMHSMFNFLGVFLAFLGMVGGIFGSIFFFFRKRFVFWFKQRRHEKN